MKFNFHWNETQDTQQIDLISHPNNKLFLQSIETHFNKEHTLVVTHPSNGRNQVIQVKEIEAIEALGHLSKVILQNQESYFYPKRLKELAFLEEFDLYQINQSTLINLKEVHLFQTEKHARIEIITKSHQHYMVSRHYAKTIKERLLCSNN